MENYSTVEVIEQAVQTEKLGYEFYTTMASRFEEEDEFRKLFETLAGKEQEHEKKFSALKDKIGDQKLVDWEEASLYLKAIVESEFFLGTNKSLPSLDHLTTVEDAIRFAMGFEKETLLYFHSLQDIVKESDIIKEIVEEERSHIVWLSEFRRNLAG